MGDHSITASSDDRGGIVGAVVNSITPNNKEPLLTRANVTSLVMIVVGILALVGVKVTTDANDLVNVILLATTGIGPIAAAWASRHKVTPVADPRAADGTPLVKLLSATTGAIADLPLPGAGA